jgi:Tfp pilus assembly protein PilX
MFARTGSNVLRGARAERGMALVTVLLVLVPLLVLVSAASNTMSGRNRQLLADIGRERALLAAESGIDVVLHRVRTGQAPITSTFDVDLGQGMRFTAAAVHWLADAVDNDADGTTDEADEDVWYLSVSGRWQSHVVNLGTRITLGTASLPIPSPLYFDGAIPFQTDDKTTISGWDRNLAGVPPATPIDVPGMTVRTVAATNAVRAAISLDTRSALQGTGPKPSLDAAPMPALDLAAMSAHAQANRDTLFAANSDFTGSVGNAAANDYRLAYCPGALVLKEDSYFAGVLVVAGPMQILKGSRFHGILICLGDLQIQEANFQGAVLMGSAAPAVQIQKSKLQYNSGVLKGALPKLGNTLPNAAPLTETRVSGWQHLRRQ